MAEERTIRFYTDANISKKVVMQLRNKGVDIIRSEDMDMKYEDDEPHLIYATEQGRVIITSDDDFLALDAKWKKIGRQHSGIVYVTSAKQGIISVIVNELLFLHEAVESGAANLNADIANQVFYIS